MLSRIGISKEDKDIQAGIQWFIDHQEKSGMWKVSYSQIHKPSENEKISDARLWITFCI
jgi:hypothetical protein